MANDGGSSMENLFQLHFVDYIVIGLMLLLSMCIGIYQALFSGGKQKTTHEYLLGNRQLGAFPVGISVFISVISAVTFIGNPAEVYINGPTFWLVSLNGFAVGLIITRTFIPVFYRLNVTSIYEYLELRFNKVVRMSAVIISVISGFIYMSFVIYAPALAISSITNLSLDLSIIVIGAVCTFYSSLGGIKAVIWADVFQVRFYPAYYFFFARARGGGYKCKYVYLMCIYEFIHTLLYMDTLGTEIHYERQ